MCVIDTALGESSVIQYVFTLVLRIHGGGPVLVPVGEDVTGYLPW